MQPSKGRYTACFAAFGSSRTRIAILALLVLASNDAEACHQRSADHPKVGANMTIDDRQFEQVPLNSRRSNVCSPTDPGPYWRGIVIQAPARAQHPASQPPGEPRKGIPICGLYTLDSGAIEGKGPMVLVAVDKQRGETFKGAVADEDPSPVIRDPHAPPRDPKRRAVAGGYFNPDLTKYLQLPVRPAVYEVFVEYGDAVSNCVTLQVLAP